MTDKGELLSDLDISDDAAPSKPDENNGADNQKNKDKDEKGGEGKEEGDDEVQRRKAGDKSHQVFTELFGDDDEEEESSEEIKKKPVKSVEKADHEEGEGKKKHKKTEEDSVDKLINGSEEAPQDEADKEEAREVSSEQEEEEEQRIDLPLLRLVHGPIENIAENARIAYAKVPPSFGAQPTSFDEDKWDGHDIRPELEFDEKKRRPKVKRRTYDVLRWRLNSFGQKESNSKLVEFDDGSVVLFVGNEPYEIVADKFKEAHNLFAQQIDADGKTFLELDAQLKERFTLTRTNVSDIANQNLQLRLNVLAHTKSASKLMTHTVDDPLKEKAAKEKQEEAARSINRMYSERRPLGLTEDFLEANENDEERLAEGRFDLEDEKANRLKNAKRHREEEEEDEEPLLDDEDLELFADDDEDERPSKKQKTGDD